MDQAERARKRLRRSAKPTWIGRFEELARYNSEVSRGLVHTPQWKDQMAEVQAEFDRLAGAGDSRD